MGAAARVLLTWQIGGDWQYHADMITEMEVTFTALGAKETRVEFEHRKLEAMGELAEATREQLESGWPGLLEAYASRLRDASSAR